MCVLIQFCTEMSKLPSLILGMKIDPNRAVKIASEWISELRALLRCSRRAVNRHAVSHPLRYT